MGYETKLPSGAILQVNAAPFADAQRLSQACAKELAPLKISASTELDLDFFKNIVCAVASSENIERALWPCLRRCLYSGVKIDDGTFEPEDARQDYLLVVSEVLKANVFPFWKGLLSKSGISTEGLMSAIPASYQGPTTTT